VAENKLQELRLQEELDPVTHLHFVDEKFLMGIPTIKEVIAIKHMLDLYKKSLGTVINLVKSQMFFLNTSFPF